MPVRREKEMKLRYEVVEFSPSEKNCRVICSSALQEDADRIVTALLKSCPDLHLHINKAGSSSQQVRLRERRQFHEREE